MLWFRNWYRISSLVLLVNWKATCHQALGEAAQKNHSALSHMHDVQQSLCELLQLIVTADVLFVLQAISN